MFAFQNGSWKFVQLSSPVGKSLPSKLRVATYNVLFDHWNKEYQPFNQKRFEFQLDSILPKLNADIIGLNEVSPDFLKLLLEREWVRSSYFLSQVDEQAFAESSNGCVFGNVVLTRYFPSGFSTFKFDTHWRDALMLEFEKVEGAERGVCFLMGHLKAGGTEEEVEKRRGQFVQVGKHFENNKDTAIFMGDLNTQKEDEMVPDGFFDLYTHLHGGNSSMQPEEIVTPNLRFTFDGKLNMLINDPTFRVRLDRIYCKLPPSVASHALSTTLNLFGTETIDDGQDTDKHTLIHNKPASDHYGISFDLSLP